MRRAALSIIILLGLAGTAVAGQSEDDASMERLRALAYQGNAVAQFALGLLYNDGSGVPQDYAEALKWYRKAAEQGHADAQAMLGFVYDDGLGVPQDYVQAHKWYNIAASRFSTSEKEKRKRVIAVLMRDRLATKMTPAQIAEAQKLALRTPEQ